MAPETFHHRNTTKTTHKPFKSKHATKGLVKELTKGKIEKEGRSHRRTPHQQVMSKLDRRNQAKQKRLNNHKDNVRVANVFTNPHCAPRIVAIVPLCQTTDAEAAVHALHRTLDDDIWLQGAGYFRTRVERFKQNIAYLTIKRDLLSALDACRVADFVVLVLSAVDETDNEAELILKAIEGQGISNVFTIVQDLERVQPAKRSQVIASLKSYIRHFFPMQIKLHSLLAEPDCASLIRSLCTTTPKGVKWREDRTWMWLEDVRWPEDNQITDGTTDGTTDVILTGVVRGQNLKANNLVQVGDWGCFQISRIVDATLTTRGKSKTDDVATDAVAVEHHPVEEPDQDQEDLFELAPFEASMEDVDADDFSASFSRAKGVLLDDHRYYSDEEDMLETPSKLPRGTSKYQSAWYLGNMSDSGSDLEDGNEDKDIEMSALAAPEDGLEDLVSDREPIELAASEYPQSEVFVDHAPGQEAEELDVYRSSRRNEAQEDFEFPDEIELHPNVLARERLIKYRGLRSLRTSPWAEEEDKPYEPLDWQRLLRVPNYKAAVSQIARSKLVGGITTGRRVSVHVRSVPSSLREAAIYTPPVSLFSLLPHEQKRTVVNIRLTLPSTTTKPIRTKSPLILQLGPRRFVINPIFSVAGNTPNNVHKYLRFLHPGQTAIASFVAPHTWGSAVPALFFSFAEVSVKNPSINGTELMATGSLAPPGPSPRIIAKRIIITGHPYKINRRQVTVRYMFFNKEDVLWFKALMLWTKRGRSGHIRESLGTHGYFKAEFDGPINPMDTVGISLYKRVWPRSASSWSLSRPIIG